MKRRTHFRVGVLPVVVVYFLLETKPSIPLAMILTAVATVSPDFDYKLGLKHRGITHTLFFTIITSILIGLGCGMGAGVIWFIAYSSHIFLDSLTKMGVPVLYPFSNKMYGLRKFKTGGMLDDWRIIYGIIFGSIFAFGFIAQFLYGILA